MSVGVDTGAPPAGSADVMGPDEDARAVRANARRPLDRGAIAIIALLILVLAQLVLGWFLLTSLNQLRDQTTAANGLQRCLISAQLNQLNSQDTTAYRNAVQSCLSR